MIHLKSQLTKTTYCMIQLIRKVQTKQSDRNGNCWRQDGCWGRRWVMASLGDENVLRCFLVMVAQLFEYTKTTGSFMSNEWITWYMNYISRKLLLKKKQKRSMGWNVLELNGWELSVFLTLKSMKSEANSLRLHRNNILHHLAIFSKCLYEQRMCQFYSFSTVGLLDLSHPNYKAVLSFGPLEYQTPLQPPKVYSALFLLF